MRLSEERYISLLTDFGFKRIFGTKPNKDVFAERKAIFDVYCENEKGEKFIVEMQNAFQKYFKDRSLFYSTFPIREQAPKGQDWNFKLDHVYTVALLNFDFKEEAFDQKEINHDIGLLDKKTFKVFNDKLTFKYIEIAKFNKEENELVTLYDKWLYVLKNLPKLDKRPKALKERIFTKLFEEAEIAKFNQQELREYEDSLKAYRDIKNSIDTAKEEGRKEGKEEGRKEEKLSTAKRLLAMGLNHQQVAQGAGLSIEEIERLI